VAVTFQPQRPQRPHAQAPGPIAAVGVWRRQAPRADHGGREFHFDTRIQGDLRQLRSPVRKAHQQALPLLRRSQAHGLQRQIVGLWCALGHGTRRTQGGGDGPGHFQLPAALVLGQRLGLRLGLVPALQPSQRVGAQLEVQATVAQRHFDIDAQRQQQVQLGQRSAKLRAPHQHRGLPEQPAHGQAGAHLQAQAVHRGVEPILGGDVAFAQGHAQVGHRHAPFDGRLRVFIGQGVGLLAQFGSGGRVAPVVQAVLQQQHPAQLPFGGAGCRGCAVAHQGGDTVAALFVVFQAVVFVQQLGQHQMLAATGPLTLAQCLEEARGGRLCRGRVQGVVVRERGQLHPGRIDPQAVDGAGQLGRGLGGGAEAVDPGLQRAKVGKVGAIAQQRRCRQQPACGLIALGRQPGLLQRLTRAGLVLQHRREGCIDGSAVHPGLPDSCRSVRVASLVRPGIIAA
jgi:hypothetical protein